jgi:hypothetical protein
VIPTGGYVDKYNSLLRTRVEEGIQEALYPRGAMSESEGTDPRYAGLGEVYFEDTEGRRALIPQAWQITPLGGFSTDR